MKIDTSRPPCATSIHIHKEALRGHWAKRLASILGTAGGQGRLEAVRRDIDCRPSLAIRHPCCPICPRHPYLPKGAKGQGTMLNQCVGQLTIERPYRSRSA